MKKFALQGSIAAMVTPFKSNGSIDYAALDKILDFHLENGTNGIVVCGTSGETPTLTEEEDARMFEYTVKRVGGKITLIAGTGSNSTESCKKYTRNAANVLQQTYSARYVSALLAGCAEHARASYNII